MPWARLLMRRSPLHLSVTLFIIVVCVSLMALNVRQLVDAREERLNEAATDTVNLARSLALQAEAEIGTADSLIIGLRERYEIDGAAPKARTRIEGLMRLRVASMSMIHGLFLFDQDGKWLANSLPGTNSNLNYADRGYFKFHHDNARDRVLVSGPVRSRADREWIITVTRRLYTANSEFAGVVDATMTTDHFQHFYDSVDIGKGGVITLISSNGLVMVRRPFIAENIGLDISSTDLYKTQILHPPTGSFEFVSVIDGIVRIGSVQPVGTYGLRVLVSREKSEILAPWWLETKIQLQWLAIVLALLILSGYRVASQIRDRMKAESLYRLLSDNSSDAIIRTASNGQQSYISPSFWTMTGWPKDRLVNKSWTDIINPEDRGILQAIVASLVEGAEEAAGIFRFSRANGTQIWVEIRARVVLRGANALLEFVGNIRDISRQKAAEDRLAEANVALEAQAMTDPLTGISNRRHFDMTLQNEWNRGIRTGHSIALLMIDADCFKQYNDIYGHVAGDECLRKIAHMLDISIRHPGDLAARYGGEEFVVILSDTLIDMAVPLAERIRKSLIDLAISHSGNEAVGEDFVRHIVVTASIGVAALVPLRDTRPEMLVEAADKALYAAKRAGRNRVSIVAS